jgi:hypothetical protein
MNYLFDMYFTEAPWPDQIRRIRAKIEAAIREGEIKTCDCGPLKVALDRHLQGLFKAYINCTCGKRRGKSIQISIR